MLTITFCYNTKAALERGLARQGSGVQLSLSDADIATLTQEQRNVLPIQENYPGPLPYCSLPDATLADLVVWCDKQIADEAQAKADEAAQQAAQLLAAQQWSADVDALLATCPPLDKWSDSEPPGVPRAPSTTYGSPAQALVDQGRRRVSNYCKPLADVRRAQNEAADEARKQAAAKAAQEIEDADLAWAAANKDKCPLLAAHVANGVRGKLLRKATRQAQIDVELRPFGWAAEQNVNGSFSYDEDKYLPGDDEYNALAAAKVSPLSDAVITLRRWGQYTKCRHGHCEKCDKDNEHLKHAWVLATSWRGEDVIKFAGNKD